MSVRVVDDGQHIELTNSTLSAIVVMGYSGEPYLMVDAQGVWQNNRSPSLYLNRSTAPGLVYMPPGTEASAAPLWQRVCRCDTARWHDHRIHWGKSSLPVVVSASPGQYHLIETWKIYTTQGAETITLTGVVEWVPGPSPTPWLVLAASLSIAIVPVGFLGRWRGPFAAGLVGLVGVDVARAAGMVAGRSGSFTTALAALPDDGIVTAVVWAAGIAAAVLAVKGRIGAVFAAMACAAILGLTSGVASLEALWHSQVLTGYPTDAERALIAATLGVAIGLMLASWVLIRRLKPS